MDKAPHLKLFVMLALRTGARKRAALDLRWTQNTKGGWVDIDRGLIDFNPIGRAQTRKRRARIPIPPRLLWFLKKAKAHAKTDFVIERFGNPVADVKRAFASACQSAGIEDCTPHVLKHTSVTWLLQEGVQTWEVAGWTGTSEDTIRRVYGHHAPGYLQAAKEVMR
jgi:integrase